MENIKQKVRAYIEDNFLMGGGKTLADGDSFMEHHVVDSTGFLELVTFIESAFGFRVEDEEMVPENLDSLDAIEAYVTRRLAAVV